MTKLKFTQDDVSRAITAVTVNHKMTCRVDVSKEACPFEFGMACIQLALECTTDGPGFMEVIKRKYDGDSPHGAAQQLLIVVAQELMSTAARGN